MLHTSSPSLCRSREKPCGTARDVNFNRAVQAIYPPLSYGCFNNLGALLWESLNLDHSIFGSAWGHLFTKSPISISQNREYRKYEVHI